VKLEEILYHVGKEKDLSYLGALVSNNEIHSLVIQSSKRHKCNITTLNDYVKYYVINYYEYSGDFVVDRFINSLQKYLGRMARNKK
jgi:hypothetical protein